MKFMKKVKSAFAGFTAIVMAAAVTLTAVPVSSVQAAENENQNLVLHWDMTKNEDGTLKDLTGNSHSGKLNNSLESAKVDGIDVLNMTGGYVDIPDGTISTDAKEITINMLVKISENIKSSWMFCVGSSNKRYLYLTGCSNQNGTMRGGVGCVPASGGNGWDYESVVQGDSALDAGVWQNITVTYKDGGKFTFYKDGVKQAEADLSTGNAGNFTLQDLMTAGDARDGYMGWSFYTGQDPKFQGTVADFRIYESELNADEVKTLSDDMADMLERLAESDFTSADINLTEEDCLGTNASAEEVTSDLVLPTTTTIGEKKNDAQITKWVSSNEDIISNDGKVTPGVVDTTVVMTATVTRNDISADKQLTFVVKGSATDADLAKADAKALTVVNSDDVAGNLTLPTTGEYGSVITWSSSDESIISTKDEGSVLAGKVNRPAVATDVTLTATITKGEAVETKEIVCHVRKAAEEVVTTDYLFAYFPYTSTKDERVYFGVSEDGLNFQSLNKSQYVLESRVGTHGIRDPFVFRSHEGDKFYLIATDLTVAGLTQDGTWYPGQGWGENQTKGSQSIVVWESDDLVNWSQERLCKVSLDTAGCTWAPEAYWDDETEQYVVFWASKVSTDGYAKQRVYYTTTRDFHTFGETKVWIEESGSVIDTTVIKGNDGYYYRYTKNEAGNTNVYGTPSKRIYCERSKSLTATKWEIVSNNSLAVSGGQIEGGCIFKINTDDVENAKKVAGLKGFTLEGDDVYCLMADKTGVTIFPGLSTNLSDGWFNVLGTNKSESVNGTSIYSMPDPDASHGTVMPITSEEYDNLLKKYDEAYAEKAKDASDKADAAIKAVEPVTEEELTAITEDITLPKEIENMDGVTVTWTSSDETVISTEGVVTRPAAGEEDAVVDLTVTITVPGADGVRDQIRSKSYVVTVKAEAKPITLESIAVTAPTKTEYTVGEELDLAGMKVTAKYSDGSTEDIAVTDCEVSGYDKTKTGEQTVTVTYEGKTNTFKVTVKEAAATPKLPYEDVAETDWFYDEVAYNYFAETMTGTDPTHFSPYATLVRAQFATILHRIEGEPVVAYTNRFPDVPDKQFYSTAVLWAADAKVVTGYTDSGYFGTNDPITREQMVVMMYRYADYKGYDTSKTAEISRFTDAGTVSEFAEEAMKWAVENEIISGKKNDNGSYRLDPQGSTSRAECAIIIQRFMEKFEK